jgi:hypothetical protein
LCISVETVGFFVTGLETPQILGVEISSGCSTKSKVKLVQNGKKNEIANIVKDILYLNSSKKLI